MGNNHSHLHASPSSSPQLIRVKFNGFHSISHSSLPSTNISSSSTASGAVSAAVASPIAPSYILYSFTISYQRYIWKISKRFSEIKSLRKYLISSAERIETGESILEIEFPKNIFRINTKPNKLLERGEMCARFIEIVGSHEHILRDIKFRRFLEIGRVGFSPHLYSHPFICLVFFVSSSGKKRKRWLSENGDSSL
jgi:hypothetical protein